MRRFISRGHQACLVVVAAALTALPAHGQSGPDALAFTRDSSTSGDYVRLPPFYPPAYTTGQMTITAWVKPGDITGYPQVMSWSRHNTPFLFFRINADGRLQVAERTYYAVNGAATSSPIVDPCVWTHVAVTFSFGQVRYYANGVFDSATSINLTNHPSLYTAAQIGSINRYGVIGSPFDGLMQDVTVWNTALSEAAIADVMDNSVDVAHPQHGNLVGHWKMDDGAGQIVTDAKSGLNGTLGANTAVSGNDPAWASAADETSVPACLPPFDVPEDYTLVYALPVPGGNQDYGGSMPPYVVDNTAMIECFDRVAYYVELNGQWIWVSMDAFTTVPEQIGVPVISTGAVFQHAISNMDVDSNVPGIVTGTGITTGNIEFWHHCYGTSNEIGIPGASNSLYDEGDDNRSASACYGSMQIHNHGAGQTLFAYNAWDYPGGGGDDLGIGDAPSGHTDWTYAYNQNGYSVRNIFMYVRECFDTDGDGLYDDDEVDTYGTDPELADTDGDGLDDGVEVLTHGTDPLDPDTDDDGLVDGDEIDLGTDPFDADTDGDALTDAAEVNTHATDPLDADSDDDELSDGAEVNTHLTNPNVPDTDGDCLLDGDEVDLYLTDPKDADSDDDGLDDGFETGVGFQWASSVLEFSSEYTSNSWGTVQALGAPNTFFYGDTWSAWAPGPINGTLEFISVGFASPVCAHGVTIRETYGNGFVYQIDVIDAEGALHTVWTGTDTSQPGSPVDFFVPFATTPFLVDAVRIYTDTDHDPNAWEEIDAIGLHSVTTGTDPNDPDSDGDGLSDGEEVNTHGTDPLDSDTDDDGISDGGEVAIQEFGCPDPLVADSDGDALPDGLELNVLETNPCGTDSDMDGLNDNLEVNVHLTDPLDNDSDDDGAWDGTEVDMQASSGVVGCPNPLNPDSDGDTLLDGEELDISLGTDPCSVDTDDDMIPDNEDDLPTTPGVTSGFIEDYLREMCQYAKSLSLDNFAAPNNNARKGRRNAMCNRINAAAKAIGRGDYEDAHDQLTSLAAKLDDENQPPDWMVHVDAAPTHKDVVRDDIDLMLFLIELEL